MKSTYIYIGLVVLLVIGLVFVRNNTTPTAVADTKYDTFAQCLSDAGAKFYGAYWCPHCQDQKKMFENSKKLPYIECSTPDGKNQIKICSDEKIEGYPTWTFTDGERINRVMELKDLSEKTSCALPTV